MFFVVPVCISGTWFTSLPAGSQRYSDCANASYDSLLYDVRCALYGLLRVAHSGFCDGFGICALVSPAF